MRNDRPRIRWRLAVAEAGANVCATPVRSMVVGAIGATVVALVLVATARELVAIGDASRQQVDAGRFVLVVRAADPTGMDAGRCDALGQLPGVRAAGAVLGESDRYPSTVPLRPLAVARVTPGFLAALHPGIRPAPPGGLVAGAAAAAELGLVAPSALRTASAASPIAGRAPGQRTDAIVAVLPPARRAPEAGRKLFDVVAPVGRTGLCHVDAEPGAAPAVERAVLGWFPPSDGIAVEPLDETLAVGRMPEAALAERVGRWLWLVGTLPLVGLHAAVWYARREEVALYRLLGWPRRALAVLVAAETMATLGVPAVVGAAVATVVAAPTVAGATPASALAVRLLAVLGLDAASGALVLALAPPLAVALTSVRSPIDVLKGY